MTLWEQNFQKASLSFGLISTKLYGNMLVRREYRELLFLPITICQIKKLGTLKFLLTQDHNYGVGNSKNATRPTTFIRPQLNFMRTLASMVEFRLLRFLAIIQALKML